MFFAYVVLRPAAVAVLEPPLRLRLWDAVFRGFFMWVWSAVAVLLVSGFSMIYFYGGFAYVTRHVYAMLVLGLAMMVIFGYVFFACYKPFALHVANQRWKEAGEFLGKIRKLIAVNLALGLVIVCEVVIGLT